MLKIRKVFLLFLFSAFLVSACGPDPDPVETGRMSLYLTDAPFDTAGVTGVYITFLEIQYHTRGNTWEIFDEFDEAVMVNLLNLVRGETKYLGTFEMPPGNYTQIRFMLEALELGQAPPTNPGCYIEFEDGSTKPLFIPSGSQSGFKAIGPFSVPLNGEVNVTADFDVRRSIVVAGASGRYILKPTIRLVVNDQAGRIIGEVFNIPEDTGIVIYAYESGDYTEEEAADPGDEEVRFPGAINSDMVCEDHKYHLDFLAEGMYDLVVISTIDGEFQEVIGVVEGIAVNAGLTTNHPIDLLELNP